MSLTMGKFGLDFTNFLKLLVARKDRPRLFLGEKPLYKGTDLDGNTYWEYWVGTKRHRISEPPNYQQIFKKHPVDLKAAASEMVPTSEWVSWLRQHREDPPTEEEVLRNLAIAYLKKQRAKQLELEERKNWPELDAKLKAIEEDNFFTGGFPRYIDLEIYPGQCDLNLEGFFKPDIYEFLDLKRLNTGKEAPMVESKSKSPQLVSETQANEK